MDNQQISYTERKKEEEAQRAFIAFLAHQLREPISSIRIALEVLLAGDDGPVNDTQREVLLESRRVAERMLTLIQALLFLSRVEAHPGAPEERRADARKAVENAATACAKEIEAKHHTISIVAHTPFVVSADSVLLEEVLKVFIVNAVRYTPPGGAITVSLKQEGDEAIFSVTDTGIGIPPEEQSRIFEPFFRGSNAALRNETGIGLGIFSAKKVVTLWGGRVFFVSRPGEGSVFSFTVPIIRDKGIA